MLNSSKEVELHLVSRILVLIRGEFADGVRPNNSWVNIWFAEKLDVIYVRQLRFLTSRAYSLPLGHVSNIVIVNSFRILSELDGPCSTDEYS